MDILFKGLKMPTSCVNGGCPVDGYHCRLWVDYGLAFVRRHPDCPLIGIPAHGDLIDRDEAAHEIWLIRCEECGAAEWACESCDNGTAMKRVMDAPVIIPAERSEDE